MHQQSQANAPAGEFAQPWPDCHPAAAQRCPGKLQWQWCREGSPSPQHWPPLLVPHSWQQIARFSNKNLPQSLFSTFRMDKNLSILAGVLILEVWSKADCFLLFILLYRGFFLKEMNLSSRFLSLYCVHSFVCVSFTFAYTSVFEFSLNHLKETVLSNLPVLNR